MSYFIQLGLFAAYTTGLYFYKPDANFWLHLLFAFCGVYWTFYLFIEAPWRVRRLFRQAVNRSKQYPLSEPFDSEQDQQ